MWLKKVYSNLMTFSKLTSLQIAMNGSSSSESTSSCITMRTKYSMLTRDVLLGLIQSTSQVQQFIRFSVSKWSAFTQFRRS